MASGPIFDLERVEVLKGPQGTLYGRNTTGGLIDQITAKPGDAFAAGITAEVGNYETYNLEGFVNLPVGETLSARLAVRSENSDKGWQKSASRPGERLGEVDNLGLRGSIKWEPDADLKVLLTANYWQNKSDRARRSIWRPDSESCQSPHIPVPEPLLRGGNGQSAHAFPGTDRRLVERWHASTQHGRQ